MSHGMRAGYLRAENVARWRVPALAEACAEHNAGKRDSARASQKQLHVSCLLYSQTVVTMARHRQKNTCLMGEMPPRYFKWSLEKYYTKCSHVTPAGLTKKLHILQIFPLQTVFQYLEHTFLLKSFYLNSL